MKKFDPRVTYEKLTSGANLSDIEVVEGAKYYSKLAMDLVYCGPVFKLASMEAVRVAQLLTRFKEARDL